MKSQASELEVRRVFFQLVKSYPGACCRGSAFPNVVSFRFSLHATPQLNGSPFLLVSGGKSSGPLNAFLNISLFVPFGFGLSDKTS